MNKQFRSPEEEIQLNEMRITGRKIIRRVVIIKILVAITAFYLYRDLFFYVFAFFNIVFSIPLISGKNWIRWVNIIGIWPRLLFTVTITLAYLMGGGLYEDYLWVFMVGDVILGAVVTNMLCNNRNVSAFFAKRYV